ncbi:Ldh family oxidoreductase [Nocardia sp. NPDC052566]|uniref:Ldh family oxidoreductase n=1 Tax=Nocardia sp. NPDC052566 TaxID=3364330 RepID=UPI0037C6CC4A
MTSVIDLVDVVLALGRDNNEQVVLRGADLHIAPGESVLVSGLDSRARKAMMALLAGRTRPGYGQVLRGAPEAGNLTVLDGGDTVGHQALSGYRSIAGARRSVVVLAGSPTQSPTDYRWLELTGGRFVPRPSGADAIRLTIAELRQRIVTELRAAGAAETAAATVAEVIVDAERRGHRSHGVALVPTYLRRIASGGIDVTATPVLTELGATTATIDANGGLGQLAADAAAHWCATTASAYGLAAVAVRNNNHIGMLAAYRAPFQRHGVIGLLTNTSGPSVAPPGAQRPTLGSNALCLVTPTASDTEPFCVDLATGVVAAGKIRDAANRGAILPPGWLQDRHGKPSRNPADLDSGGAIPLFGGYKGLCVTLIVEVLAGILAGQRISPQVAKQRKQPETTMGCSQMFIGFSAAHFGAEPADLVDDLIDQAQAAVLSGHDRPPARPWFPDQMERDHTAQAERDGVTIPATVCAELGWAVR